MKAMRAVKEEMKEEADRPSFGELIGRLATDSNQLVRAEITLAKREVSQKIEESADSVKLLAIGAVFGFGALISFCAFFIFVLATWLPLWASAGIVTVLFGLGAFLAIMSGISRWRQNNLKPEQTIETLEEDKRWIKKLEFPG
jgi:VIT1/CCC1 family predicted Fe2+/Mn2+ transporter